MMTRKNESEPLFHASLEQISWNGLNKGQTGILIVQGQLNLGLYGKPNIKP